LFSISLSLSLWPCLSFLFLIAISVRAASLLHLFSLYSHYFVSTSSVCSPCSLSDYFVCIILSSLEELCSSCVLSLPCIPAAAGDLLQSSPCNFVATYKKCIHSLAAPCLTVSEESYQDIVASSRFFFFYVCKFTAQIHQETLQHTTALCDASGTRLI